MIYQCLILIVGHDLPNAILDRVLVGLDEPAGRADEDCQGLEKVTQFIVHTLRLLLAGLQVLCKSGTNYQKTRRSNRFVITVVYLVIGRSALLDWICFPSRWLNSCLRSRVCLSDRLSPSPRPDIAFPGILSPFTYYVHKSYIDFYPFL